MKAPLSMRIWFAVVATILWAGIYFTGFSTVNWLLYLPAAGFLMGAVTGFCPSLTGVFKLFGGKIKETSNK